MQLFANERNLAGEILLAQCLHSLRRCCAAANDDQMLCHEDALFLREVAKF
jgi:hypothetical protein